VRETKRGSWVGERTNEKRREEKRRVRDVASQAVHAQGTKGGGHWKGRRLKSGP